MARPLRVATRGSELALVQAGRVATLLRVPSELVIVSTRGDRDRATALHVLGGTGVFVKEVQEAVLADAADIAVHSAKDLPSSTPDGLVLACVPERVDVRDALVGATLETLPVGACVATGSVRRRAQLAHARPDLTFTELRGNMGTRLARVDSDAVDAVVVAAAALDRLGLGERIAQRLAPSVMTPQVAQGALAVECRADDEETRALLAEIDDVDAHVAVRAERAFLAELGEGCSLPVGAWARYERPGGDRIFKIDGVVASLDGHVVLRASAMAEDPPASSASVAPPASSVTPPSDVSARSVYEFLGRDLAVRLRDGAGRSLWESSP